MSSGMRSAFAAATCVDAILSSEMRNEADFLVSGSGFGKSVTLRDHLPVIRRSLVELTRRSENMVRYRRYSVDF